MNYYGTITWLRENGKYLNTSVTATIDNDILEGKFVLEGFPYHFRLHSLKPNYFAGKILDGQEECGMAYVWKYTKDSDHLFQGQWEEYGFPYQVFIQLSVQS